MVVCHRSVATAVTDEQALAPDTVAAPGAPSFSFFSTEFKLWGGNFPLTVKSVRNLLNLQFCLFLARNIVIMLSALYAITHPSVCPSFSQKQLKDYEIFTVR